MATFNITVMGGLPVTIKCSIGAKGRIAESPKDMVQGWEVTHIAGRKLRNSEMPDWIYKRLTDEDVDYIMQKCCEASYDAETDAKINAANARYNHA